LKAGVFKAVRVYRGISFKFSGRISWVGEVCGEHFYR
jgi:hypothetical protein